MAFRFSETIVFEIHSSFISREISVMGFRCSETMVGIHSNFTHDSEIYNIVKLYYDSFILHLSQILFSSQIKFLSYTN